jgi:hypothetical protein
MNSGYAKAKANNMTVTAAAELMGISRAAVSNYWRLHPEMRPAWKVAQDQRDGAAKRKREREAAPERRPMVYAVPVKRVTIAAAAAASTADARPHVVTMPCAPWEMR